MPCLSTMDDTLVNNRSQPLSGDTSGNTSPASPFREVGPTPLSSSSSALINQFFGEVTPICRLLGHPTIAFIEGQNCSILKAVASQTARVSFDVVSGVVDKASRLHLGDCSHRRNSRPTSAKANPMFATDYEPERPTRESSTSRADFTSDMSQNDGVAGSSTRTPGYLPSLASVTHIPSSLVIVVLE